jgi:hypothetical protein
MVSWRSVAVLVVARGFVGAAAAAREASEAMMRTMMAMAMRFMAFPPVDL